MTVNVNAVAKNGDHATTANQNIADIVNQHCGIKARRERMNREIKFRAVCAFNVDDEVHDTLLFRKGEMVFGQVVFYNETPFIVGPIVEVDGDDISIESWCQVEPETLGQFTGLRDKNGVEIYEGDVVDFVVFDHNGADSEYKGVVTWGHSEWEIWHSPDSEFYGSDGGFHFGWVCSQDDEITVIGNIHQNPELLEIK